ncbi:MAG: exosome complex RNA-binding protein Csl4 [Candidatus Micrarchaeota archaeon]
MKERLVVPGDFLCYSEEYSPAGHAFEDSEGKVFSSVVGRERSSDAQRNVSVASPHAKRALKAGDLVYARIEDLYDTVALTRMKPAAPGIAPNSDSAFLRISEIRRGYVESFRGHLGIGDVLIARIKEITPLGIYLTVIENDLGVLRAFCSNCRREMLFTARGFYCKACESGEERKTLAPGAQPALFVEPSPSPPRDMRGREGGPRRDFGGGRGERSERGDGRRRDFGRDSRGGERDRRSFGGGRERGGDRREGRDRGPPRRDFGGGHGERGGGRRDSRGSGGPLGGRRKNIGSYYPAN